MESCANIADTTNKFVKKDKIIPFTIIGHMKFFKAKAKLLTSLTKQLNKKKWKELKVMKKKSFNR